MSSGKPLLSCFQVLPPSVDLKMPPLVPFHVRVFPRTFARFPERSVNDLRIRRIDLHIVAARVFVLVKRLLESLAAIDRKEDTAFLVRPIGMSGHRHEQVLGIAGIDRDLRDLLAVAQAEMRPGFARVGRFVDAVADGEIGPMKSFAAPDVDDFGSEIETASAPTEAVG